MIANPHASPTLFSRPVSAKLAALGSVLADVKRRLLRGRDDRETGGYWQSLKAPPDNARLLTCVGLLRCHARQSAVLEVGCGDGLLMQYVTPDDYATWLGIDESPQAIHRAQQFGNDRTRYVVADIDSMEPNPTFDVIVFSEPIYYLPDPAAFLRRYARCLKPCGIIILSIFDDGIQAPVWRDVHSVAYPIDSCAAKSAAGTWTCEALRMRRTTWHMPVADGLL